MRDVSVIIPTLNCRSLAERSLPFWRRWLAEVGEVLVVDGSSSDGTVDFLKQELAEFEVQYEVMEPGLYQGWNRGVERASGKFVYYATVGDSISAEELRYLHGQATETGVDVVIGTPGFEHPDGSAASGVRWPIHSILENRPEQEERYQPSDALAWIALTHCQPPFRYQSFLGSSASNLYRRDFLKQHPWPVDGGHSGDSLFGLRHAMEMKVLFCRRECGRFLLHQEDGRSDGVHDAAVYGAFREAYDSLLEAVMAGEPEAAFRNLLWSLSEGQRKGYEFLCSLETAHRATLHEIAKKEALREELTELKEVSRGAARDSGEAGWMGRWLGRRN